MDHLNHLNQKSFATGRYYTNNRPPSQVALFHQQRIRIASYNHQQHSLTIAVPDTSGNELRITGNSVEQLKTRLSELADMVFSPPKFFLDGKEMQDDQTFVYQDEASGLADLCEKGFIVVKLT